MKKIFILISILTLYSHTAQAATINVDHNNGDIADDGKCSITEALENANGPDHNAHPDSCTAGSDGPDTIILQNDVTLTTKYSDDGLGQSGTPATANGSKVILDGGNFTLSRDDTTPCDLNGTQVDTEYRLLQIVSGGELSIINLGLKDGCADGIGSTNEVAGGAILNLGKLSVDNSTISGNKAGELGGGIFSDNSISSIMNSVISDNSAVVSGGGVYNEGAISSITNSTISGNSVTTGSGGGIALASGTITKITKSTFDRNLAVSGTGGALYVHFASTVTDISNNTFSNNLAKHDPGGGNAIYQQSSGVVTKLRNNTFFQTDYSTNTYVLSLRGVTSPLNLVNNLFTGRTTGNTAYCNFDPTASLTLSKNITNLSNSQELDCHDATLGTLTSVDVALKDNSCVTAGPGATCVFTLALLDGSTAINAGASSGCPIDDQRGFARDTNCDIGAYEYGATTAPILDDCDYYVTPIPPNPSGGASVFCL